MTTLPEGGVLGLATGVVLHGDTGPMVERPAEPWVAGKPSGDDTALAGALGHRRRATKCPQCLVVSALQRLPAFCEQRGEDDPAVSWQFATAPTGDPECMKPAAAAALVS